jgi:hypothetical protein
MSSVLILIALSALSGWEVANSHGLQFLWLGPCWPRFRPSHFKIRVLALFRESLLPSLALRSTNPPTCLGRSVPGDGSVEDHLPQQRADDKPKDGRDDDIRRKHEQQQNSQFNRGQLTNQRQADLTP